ncbi:DUF6008 family protein [Streptomyces sp. CB02460]|uniref:DUF6008 family protein n=1 Tax=Streptomyces sp. CB02460 TaxID=1703941 RepID=UPI00093EBA76|nr:DUF6008 family protein [Streptomyces sp. CB02460]OKJ78274.1 hypothetical protein AMK30_04540 [Streptomyces sp. CB02460]
MPGMTGMPGMESTVSTADTLGAVFIIAWAVAMWVAVAVLAVGNRRSVRPWVYKFAVALIGIGVVGQVGHFQEHVAQAAYWIAHPYDPAWMTPWGNSFSRGLGQIDPSKPSLGMEILHLAGNFIFLAGLVGIVQITHRVTGELKSRKWARMGVWMQGIHGLEHIVLTASIALGASRAIGLSTWFGAIEPGPALATYRVWWHFVANAVGTVILGISVYHLWKEKRAVKASFAPEEEAPAVLPAEDGPARTLEPAGRP